ncbi:hybrid sensor histidine kinase/response regulator [Labrys sp. 22185]|uniref:hybrid sensor histidine kinase/response regulator n=1 Tax=Labrys sp. 22185 TaxID=3453888 RepID=UPI003F862C33
MGAAFGSLTYIGRDAFGFHSFWASRPEAGPFYWPGAQANVAFQNVRTDLLLVAAGASVPPHKLRTEVDVLISRINLITRPSELNDTYRKIPGYAAVEPTLIEFATRILPSIESNVSPNAASELLPQFDELNTKLLRLSNEGWIKDGDQQEATLREIERDKKILLWASAVLFLLLLGVWFLYVRLRRATAGQREALEAEKAAVDAKGRFLGMVSHELRSPLQSIVSALDMIERAPGLAGQVEWTDRIRRSANSLTVQLRDMLTLARADSGWIELRPDVFDASELVHAVIEPLRLQAAEKGLAVNVDVPDGLFVVADGARIEQILQNLIGNAIKYTESGSVSVQAELRGDRETRVLFKISDTGPGLHPPLLDALNKGADVASSRQPSRRGIGLAVVQTLVRQMGATLHAERGEGAGVVVSVSVPVVVAGDKPPRLNAVEGRVLIVDDRPDLLEGLASVCRSLGHTCDTASSAAAALNHVAAHIYGTIIIDLEMPGMSGLELATQIRNQALNGKAKLVALSASANLLDADIKLFDQVLDKPVPRDRLTDILRF